MPIDFTPFIDLTPLDISPSDIYSESIDVAAAVLPEFNLRRGTIEDAMFQAFAYMSSLNIAAINRIPSRVLEGAALLAGYERFQGTRATVSATVSALDSDGGTIPAGTVFVYSITEADGTVVEYSLESIQDVFLDAETPPTIPTGTIQLASRSAGYVPVIPTGTSLICITTNNIVDTTVTTNTFVQGLEPDADGEYLSGLVTYMQSLSANFTTAKQIETGVLASFRNVSRIKVYDLTDSSDLSVGAADEPGYVTIFVYGYGRTLTSTERGEILLYVQQKTVPGLNITVSNFTLIDDISVTLTIGYNSLLSSTAVEDYVESAIVNYLNPNTYPTYETGIRASSVSGAVAASGVILYVTSCEIEHDAGAEFDEAANTGVQELTYEFKGRLPNIPAANITITATPITI